MHTLCMNPLQHTCGLRKHLYLCHLLLPTVLRILWSSYIYIYIYIYESMSHQTECSSPLYIIHWCNQNIITCVLRASLIWSSYSTPSDHSFSSSYLSLTSGNIRWTTALPSRRRETLQHQGMLLAAQCHSNLIFTSYINKAQKQDDYRVHPCVCILTYVHCHPIIWVPAFYKNSFSIAQEEVLELQV